MNPFDPRPALAGTGLVFLSALALAQTPADPDEVKVEPERHAVLDIKTEWPVPHKPAGEAAGPEQPSHAAPGAADAFPPVKLPEELRGITAPSFADRVLFDEPGDGALWAKGGNAYKARFDAEGATYFPYFGPETPRHYPLSFSLQEVLVGGRLLHFESDAAYELAGSTVLYDRGSLIEYYEVRPESMEQLFHFDSLPAGGDLVVRIGVDTELAVSAEAERFELSNEFGRVGYSRAVVLDSRGRQSAAPTSFGDGMIEIRVPASFLETAAWPITIDPVITTFDVSVDPNAHAFSPDVAYDQTTDRWNIVWEQVFNATDHDIYSQLRTGSGALVAGSEVTIDFTTACWKKPSVANNQIASQFLTVSQASQNCSSPRTIRGRTRQADSNTMGAQFEISPDLTGDKLNPDVGGDPVTSGPTYYCVVWQRVFSSTDHDIHYQLVRADSTLLFPSTQFIDNSGATLDRFPSVSKSNGQRPFSSQEWNIAFQRQFSPTDEDIRGAQVHWDGSITTPSFSMDFASANDRFPRASSPLNGGPGPRPYLVVYQRGSGTSHNIQARAFIGDSAVTLSTDLTALEGVALSQDQIQPAVDTDGTTFTVVYSEQFATSATDYDIYISTFDLALGSSSLVTTEVHRNLAFSSTGEFRPRLTSRQSATDGQPSLPNRFMAVWDDNVASGAGNIEGGTYDSISPPGTPFCFGGASCPCSNPGGPGQGCRNSTGAGAVLSGTGTNRISRNNLTLHAVNAIPNNPGLFFQGTTALGGGSGNVFGNGLRCAGIGVVRIGVVFPNASGAASIAAPVSVLGVSPGDTRRYQFWYRDTAATFPCTSNFNLSNGYEITWTN